MELLYFSDISQLDYVRAYKPDMLKQTRPVTGDMVVSFELEKLGVDFIDEWDFLKPEDIEKNWETAHLLSRTWWDEHLASTEYEGFSLADAARQDLVYPFWASLNARMVYDRIFDAYPVEKIYGYFLPAVGVVRTGPAPASRAVRSVTQAIFLFIAELHGIPVDRLNSSLPLALGAIADKGRSLSRIKAPEFSETGNAADKIILVYETGMPASEHAELLKAIDKMLGVRIISISQHELEIGTLLDVKGSLQIFWNRFVEFCLNYDGDYPEIFANTHLLFQFERIKNEMETALAYGDVFTAFLVLMKPSLVIFGHEAFTLERVLVRLARNRKIPTACLVHGGLGPKYGFRGIVGDADAVMVWNEIDIEYLMSFGIEKARLNKIGSIRYESNYVEYAKGYRIDSPKTKGAAKERLGVSQDKPLITLLTAQINTGFAAPVAEPGKHREAIRGLLALVDSRQDLQFIIKAHPGYDYFELYGRLLDAKRPNLAFIEQATLNDVLEASDICLLINYCTTAALEAMLRRVPVVFLENAVYPLHDWQDNLSETGIQRVKTMSKLEKSIDSLLTGRAINEQALTMADKQLKQSLGVDEDSAAHRLFNVVKHAIDDQQTGKPGSLLNAKVMSDFLFPHIAKNGIPGSNSSDAIITHTGKQHMYVFAYLAGVNNLGLASLRRIFEVFQRHARNEESESWQKARWLLLPAFIAGRIKNPMRDDSVLSIIWLLRSYLFHPHKLISAPFWFRKYVGKHLILHLAGHRSPAIIQIVRNLRNGGLNR